jgi:hypothetical protein
MCGRLDLGCWLGFELFFTEIVTPAKMTLLYLSTPQPKYMRRIEEFAIHFGNTYLKTVVTAVS